MNQVIGTKKASSTPMPIEQIERYQGRETLIMILAAFGYLSVIICAAATIYSVIDGYFVAAVINAALTAFNFVYAQGLRKLESWVRPLSIVLNILGIITIPIAIFFITQKTATMFTDDYRRAFGFGR